MSVLVVTGRVGKDAEKRTTQGGTDVLSFSVADTQGYGDKKQTLWVKCALFGKRAATLEPYVTKGSLVEVVGVPNVEAWVDKQSGAARASITLNVSDVKLHGGGDRADRPVADQGRATSPPPADDMPF